MPSVGSSSTISLGCIISARDRQLLLLPTRKVAAAATKHGLEHWKQIEQFARELARRPRQAGIARFQVLAHRQQGKDLPALRHVGHAEPGALVRFEPRDLAAIKDDAAVA